MASKFGILTATELANIVNFNLSVTDESSVRIYSDAYIEAQISQAEYIVFGFVHQTYTTVTIPNDVMFGVREMAKIYMQNILIRDGFLDGQIIDEIAYFNDAVKQLLRVAEADGFYIEAALVDHYQYD